MPDLQSAAQACKAYYMCGICADMATCGIIIAHNLVGYAQKLPNIRLKPLVTQPEAPALSHLPRQGAGCR